MVSPFPIILKKLKTQSIVIYHRWFIADVFFDRTGLVSISVHRLQLTLFHSQNSSLLIKLVLSFKHNFLPFCNLVMIRFYFLGAEH